MFRSTAPLALNQYMERDLDARMDRTRHRPLPEGRVHPGEALVLGCALLVAGVTLLALAVRSSTFSCTRP